MPVSEGTRHRTRAGKKTLVLSCVLSLKRPKISQILLQLIMINWQQNFVSCPIRSVIILVIKQIGPPATRSSDFVNHSYDYRSNWTPLSPITIIYKNQEYNRLFCFCFFLSLCLAIPNLSGRRLKGRGRGRSFLSPAPKIPCPFPFKRLPRRLCHSFSPLYMCSLSFSLLIFCFFLNIGCMRKTCLFAFVHLNGCNFRQAQKCASPLSNLTYIDLLLGKYGIKLTASRQQRKCKGALTRPGTRLQHIVLNNFNLGVDHLTFEGVMGDFRKKKISYTTDFEGKKILQGTTLRKKIAY